MRTPLETPLELRLRDVDFLFLPWEHRKLPLSTRVVMTTMLHSLAPGGLPTPGMVDYYYQRARRDVGLILTENVAVCPCATDNPDHAEFYSGAALRLWKQVCQAVHRTPCRIAPVLWHAGELHTGGSRRRPGDGEALSPSGINPITLERTGDPMSVQRMREIIRAYAQASLHAQLLGFDAVAVNGGDMSLIDQFFRADTNRRTDEYGGDIDRRTRFARELICAVRKAVGSKFPIILRISQTEAPHLNTKLAKTPQELSGYLQPLCEMGVDIFDCASPDAMQPAFDGSPLTFAGWVRTLTGKPAIAISSEGIPATPVPRLADQAQKTAAATAPAPPTPITDRRQKTPGEVSGAGVEPAATKPGPPRAGRTPGTSLWLHSLVHMLRAGEIDLLSFGHALLHNPAWVSDIRNARGEYQQVAPVPPTRENHPEDPHA